MNTIAIPGNTVPIATRFGQSPNVSCHTMSSHEIAELTGSSHDNVLKKIRALVANGVVASNHSPYVQPPNGQVYRGARLAEFYIGASL
jgi:phage regulator Rha-like protein